MNHEWLQFYNQLVHKWDLEQGTAKAVIVPGHHLRYETCYMMQLYASYL